MRFPRLFIFVFLVLFICCSREDYNADRYQQAINYIRQDKNLLSQLEIDHPQYRDLVYKDDEMVYKIYPERPNFFFLEFRPEIKQKYPAFDIDSANVDNKLELDVAIDSTMLAYSKSDTAHIKIFFSEIKDNLLASEVFFKLKPFKHKPFDDYRGISRTNRAVQYLFVFNKTGIDTVYKDIQQYE